MPSDVRVGMRVCKCVDSQPHGALRRVCVTVCVCVWLSVCADTLTHDVLRRVCVCMFMSVRVCMRVCVHIHQPRV